TAGATQELLVGTAGAAPAHLLLSGEVDPSRPLRPDHLPPGPAAQRVGQLAGGRALVPVVRCVTRRRSGIALDARGVPTLSVHLDEVIAHHPGLNGAPTASWRRPVATVEVVRIPGYEQVAAQFAAELSVALGTDARPAEPVPGDLLDLVAARAVATIDRGARPAHRRADRDDEALRGFRSVLRGLAEELDRAWEPAADHLDDEALNDLRLAIDRTRTLLATGRRILPPKVRRRYRAGFAALGAVTATARDLDVHLASWDRHLAPLGVASARALEPVREALAAERARAHREVARTLRSPTARDLQAGWLAWLELPEDEVVGGSDAHRRLGVVLAARIRSRHERLLDDAHAVDEHTPPAHLHELGKDGQRLRCLLEGFGHLGGRKRAQRATATLQRLQDGLGALQDTQTQAAWLRTRIQVWADGDQDEAGATRHPTTRAAAGPLLRLLDEQQALQRAEAVRLVARYRRRKHRTAVVELTERMAR
ncbi:MAG: CHAD domain-containing protein, partial [Nitriliruptoraceae bacterium]